MSNSNHTYHYSAFGLKIRSAVCIPQLIPLPHCNSPDIHIQVDSDRRIENFIPIELLAEPSVLKVDREQAQLYFKNTGVFLIEQGHTITVIPDLNLQEQTLAAFLSGGVMAVLLYQRDFLILHGSAVNISGKAVLFLGDSGEGKSSTAAALQAQGYPQITDDLAAVTIDQGTVMISPSIPQTKLSLEMADALGYRQELQLSDSLQAEKYRYRLPQEVSQLRVPLSHIYFLSTSTEFSINPLSIQTGLLEIIKHAGIAPMLHQGDVQHFCQCSQLATLCQTFALKRPKNITFLQKLIKLIESHSSGKI